MSNGRAEPKRALRGADRPHLFEARVPGRPAQDRPERRHRDERIAGVSELTAAHSDHGRHSRDSLVLDFMPLARRIASAHRVPRHQEDLEQVAYLALVKAADRFDPARGNGFSAFAIPSIEGAVKNHLRDHTWDLHVARPLQELAVRVLRVRNQLATELGRQPAIEEIAARVGVSTREVSRALEAADARDVWSLDAPLAPDNGDGKWRLEAASHDERLAQALERGRLRGAIKVLSHRERLVIGMRFFLDLTQTEIAERLGISQMQVSRLLRRALKRMNAHESDSAGDGPREALCDS